MHRSTLFVLAALTTACNQEIMVNELPDHNGGLGEQGSEPVVDAEDDTEPADEPSEPVDEADPTDPVDQVDPVDDPPPADDCAETEDLIYVIDRAEEAIYTFDPLTSQFALVGDLDCGMFEGTPASMAIGRDGVAYVRYSSDSLFAVDLASMECAPTAYGASFGSFGMGYATQNAETWRDDLYVANANTLARIDLDTYALGTVGTLPSQSELTGNAAGELWAFLPLERPAALVRLDKTDARELVRHELPAFSLADLDTFAFATWGGEFFLFVRYYGMGSTTDVYRVDANGTMNLAAADTGMDVVGAGVSTCAPTE